MKVCKRHHVNCSLSIILGKQINKFSSPWHFKGHVKKKKGEMIPPKAELLTSVISLLILALAWAVAKRIIVSKVRAVTGIVYKKRIEWKIEWRKNTRNTVSLLYFVFIERERNNNVNILSLFNHYLWVNSVLLHHAERIYDYKRGKAIVNQTNVSE